MEEKDFNTVKSKLDIKKERLAFLEQQKVKLVAQIKKEANKETMKNRKERDRKKYILAGNVLKVLDLNIDEIDMGLIVAQIALLNDTTEEKKSFLKRRGDRILEKWETQK